MQNYYNAHFGIIFPKKKLLREETFLQKAVGIKFQLSPYVPPGRRRPPNRPDDTFGNILTIGKYVSKAV